MAVLESVAFLLGCVLVLTAGATLLWLDRTQFTGVQSRLRATAPYLIGLVVVLGVNRVARTLGPELSWLLGWNITGTIYRLEGESVAVLQSVATPWLTTYFAAVYLVGYTFLLVFPFVAYLALPDTTTLRRTAVAYGINYTVGLLCYVLFIAYGPRNLVPGTVEPLLYEAFPRTQLVTSQLNANTNVFPSLHTSLSVTVAAIAWRTRERYPGWAVVASVLAVNVAISTMYLGIHWATDVVAGALLGLAGVGGAIRLVRGE